MTDVRDMLQDMGYHITCENGEFARMRPLYRDSDNDTVLSVNLRTGQFKDFKTGLSGTIQYLARITTGEELPDFEPATQKDMSLEFPIKFNKEIIKTLLPSYNFYNKKGISIETLKFFDSGLCTEGRLSDRIVFPIFHSNGELRGLSGRDATGKKTIKWKHLGRGTSWDYPYFYVKDFIKDEVFLVESIGDMLALFEAGIKNVLVLFGVSIKKELLCRLLSMNLKKIFITTNIDENKVGQEAALKLKSELEKWFGSNKIHIKHPPEEFNDLGDMSKEEILKWKNTVI